jgi:hypothetical protein
LAPAFLPIDASEAPDKRPKWEDAELEFTLNPALLRISAADMDTCARDEFVPEES